MTRPFGTIIVSVLEFLLVSGHELCPAVAAPAGQGGLEIRENAQWERLGGRIIWIVAQRGLKELGHRSTVESQADK